MRETKTFFMKGNKLNKGYTSDNDDDVKKLEAENIMGFVPPLDMLEQYEALHPGFVQKMLEHLDKEQKHRHQLEIAEQEDLRRASKKERNFNLFLGTIYFITLVYLGFFATGWVIDVVVLIAAIGLFKLLVKGGEIKSFFSGFMKKSGPKERAHISNGKGNTRSEVPAQRTSRRYPNRSRRK